MSDDTETIETTSRDAARKQRQADIRKRLDDRVQERIAQRESRGDAERDGSDGEGLFSRRTRRDRDDDEYPRDDRSARSNRSARSKGRGLFGFGSGGSDRDRPRTGARRSVMAAITQLPNYLRLLVGLITDRRVSRLDRLFVIAAVAYIVSPIDLIPDVIPFFGEVDDVFLLMLALQRLVNNAGRPVLLSHWNGDPDDVHNLNFARIVSAAGFFLPTGIKKRLFKMAGLARKFRL